MIQVKDWSDQISLNNVTLNRKYFVGLYIWRILRGRRIAYNLNSETHYLKKLKRMYNA